MKRIYMCIDLKSFYASVECVERGLDPIKTNLVVADEKRTSKTICLAVSPSLKEYGISGRARLFEVISKVKEVNRMRRMKGCKFIGKSYDHDEIVRNKLLELDFIVAPPRMKLYMKYSSDIYKIYLKYLSKDDIFVYSIDEVFCDITDYLKYNGMSSKEFVTKIINDVYQSTGITATAGIGENLYLAKVAMDIVAKHVYPNSDGVRIAFLDEMKYRKLLWNHRPLTDFWRIGKGYAKRLEMNGIYTMGDIAKYSLHNEELFYKLFGVNAEILIDHAWGFESCQIKDIKSYKPMANSLSSGQVLTEGYTFDKTKLIIKEMIDLITLDMVSKNYVSDSFALYIGYDVSNLTIPHIRSNYYGEVKKDYYGRMVPKPVRMTVRLDKKTSSFSVICEALLKMFDEKIDKNLLIKRVNISVCNLTNYDLVKDEKVYKQFDIFSDSKLINESMTLKAKNESLERKVQNAIVDLKNKYGKNAILKAMNLEEGAKTIERNLQVGGHMG